MTKNRDEKFDDNGPYGFIRDHRIGYNSQTKEVSVLPLLGFEESNLNAIHLNQNSIFVKSRQMHFSSLVSAYAAWFIASNSNKNICVICPNGAQAREFLNKTRVTLQHYFGESWKENMPINSLTCITLKNNSYIKVVADYVYAGKSEALDLLIFDEAAYINHIEDIWMAAGMTLMAREGKCIMYSSVNYENDFFLTTYYNAKKGENNFMPVKRIWSDNPYNNTSFYENMVQRLGAEVVKQELDCIARIPGTKSNELKSKRNNIITFRVDDWLEKEITKKLIQKSEELKENYTISTYLRELILKDLK